MLLWSSSGVIKKLFISILLALTLSLTMMGLTWQYFLQTPLAITHPMFYTIKPGQTLSSVSADLKTLHVVNHPRYFLMLAKLKYGEQYIQAGTYELTSGMTVTQLLEKFMTGDMVRFKWRIGEGWTFVQIAAQMHQEQLWEEVVLPLSQAEMLKDLGRHESSLEGLLFPDTYYFLANSTDATFLKRAMEKMDKILAQEWAERALNLPYKTPYDALIAASIVEKETGVDAERTKVAGVIVRRLQKGMPLQADPTVIYGLGAAYKNALTKADLVNDTPYNTYTRRGLPPTPIATVSLASLHAALHPDQGDTLYFVADGSGGHTFSSTLNQHVLAVAKYRAQESNKDKKQ